MTCEAQASCSGLHLLTKNIKVTNIKIVIACSRSSDHGKGATRCTSRYTPLSERLEQAKVVNNTHVIYNPAVHLNCKNCDKKRRSVKNRGLKLSPRHSVKKSTLLQISPKCR